MTSPLCETGVAFAAAVSLAACVPRLPERPQALDEIGVRLGGEWLEKTTLHEDARLGSITQVQRRKRNGELAIVGTRGAVFLPMADGSPRFVPFAEPAGEAELVEWPDGRSLYLDRGGGGWRTGGLFGADGALLWQPDHELGMDDLAVGDLDGDGAPEFVVGYNGGGGIRLLDASGNQRWREDDANVWHVEIADADGDGRMEIIHSNAAGLLTLRDGTGKVIRRIAVESYLSQFSLTRWPEPQLGLLQVGDGHTNVLDFDGRVRLRLDSPETTRLCRVRGATAQLGGSPHLVVTASQSNWDRAQLFVFSQEGALRYREVLPAECAAVAAPDQDAILSGCGPRLVRYTERRGQ